MSVRSIKTLITVERNVLDFFKLDANYYDYLKTSGIDFLNNVVKVNVNIQ